jgi:hypothetical protein
MSTMDTPTFTGLLVMKLANRARAKREGKAITRTMLQTIVRIVWHLAGFSSLTYAAFLWDMKAGFVVLGISCFVMSTLTTATNDVSQSDPMARRRA